MYGKFSICAKDSEIRNASAWLEQSSSQQGVPEDQIARLDICLNETLANIISHAGLAAEASPISICLVVNRQQVSGEAEVTVSDSGVAFDPTVVEAKISPKTLEEAVPGGLGLIMMRANADKISYRYSDGKNQLKFSVVWSNASR